MARRALLLACVLGVAAAAGGCGGDGSDPAGPSSTTTVPCGRSPIHDVRLALPADFDARPVPGLGGGAEASERCALHYVSPDRPGRFIEVVEGDPPEQLPAPRSVGTYRWGPVHEGFMAVPTTPAGVFVRAYGVGEADVERMLAT